MRLDRYKQFLMKLNENLEKEELRDKFEHWIDDEYLEDLFLPFIDEDYEIEIDESYFNDKKDINLEEDPISVNDSLYIGWSIFISTSKFTLKDDVTKDYLSILTHFKQLGYKVFAKYDSAKGYHGINFEYVDPEMVHFKNGKIIIWIPEKDNKPIPSEKEEFDSDDIYEEIDGIFITIRQTDSYKVDSELELAKIYKWEDYKVEKNRIYCEVDMETMADIFLSRNSRHYEPLVNGLECDDYYFYNDEYFSVDDLFRWHLTSEQEDLISKYVMKTIKLEEILEFIESEDDEDLSEKSTEEVREYLLKNCLEDFCKSHELELIEELLRTLRDYEASARCDEDQEAIYNEFDRKLEYEEIDFDKEWVMDKKYYYVKNPNTGVKVQKYYDEYNWVYKIYYQQRWIEDYDFGTFYNETLLSLFKEWGSNAYFSFDLSPNYSDYASIDNKALEKDFDSLIKSYLKD